MIALFKSLIVRYREVRDFEQNRIQSSHLEDRSDFSIIDLFICLFMLMYVISPIDVFPEKLVGAFGLMDDIALLVFSIAKGMPVRLVKDMTYKPNLPNLPEEPEDAYGNKIEPPLSQFQSVIKKKEKEEIDSAIDNMNFRGSEENKNE